MKKQITFVLTILLLASFASADIYIKSKTHSDPVSMMGQNQPATDIISEQWIGDNQFAMVSETGVNVIDLKKNVMYMINHKSKTYVEASLPLDMTKYLPAQALSMAGMMKITMSVKPTGGKKTIGQWSCDEYDVTTTMMGMSGKMMVYATEDLPFDAKIYTEKFAGPVMKAMSFGIDDASIKEMMKIKGFQIASETNMEMMGAKIRTTTEVLEISKKTAPAGIYAVPAGYTKQDKIDIPGM